MPSASWPPRPGLTNLRAAGSPEPNFPDVPGTLSPVHPGRLPAHALECGPAGDGLTDKNTPAARARGRDEGQSPPSGAATPSHGVRDQQYREERAPPTPPPSQPVGRAHRAPHAPRLRLPLPSRLLKAFNKDFIFPGAGAAGRSLYNLRGGRAGDQCCPVPGRRGDEDPGRSGGGHLGTACLRASPGTPDPAPW